MKDAYSAGVDHTRPPWLSACHSVTGEGGTRPSGVVNLIRRDPTLGRASQNPSDGAETSTVWMSRSAHVGVLRRQASVTTQPCAAATDSAATNEIKRYTQQGLRTASLTQGGIREGQRHGC